MANCAAFEGLLAAAVYDDLSPAERGRLEAHLAACVACRTSLDELRATARVLGSGSLRTSPAERRRIVAAVGEDVAPRRRRLVTRRSWAPYVAAAATLALALLLWAVARKPTPPSTKEPITFVKPEPAAPPPKPAPAPKPQPPEKAVGQESQAVPEPPRTPPPVPAPAEPTPQPPPPPVPAPPPTPADPPAPRKTVAMVAVLERGGDRVDVPAGQRLQTGSDDYAVLAYPDGTRVELFPATEVVVGDDPLHKHLQMERGSLRAVVAKQPAGRPMRLRTSQAEATVLGTTLRLSAGPDRTRLEVHEGRVRFARGEASIEVPAGHAAVADAGPLAARPLRATLGLLALYRPAQAARIPDVSFAGRPMDLRVRNPGATIPRPDGLTVQGQARIRNEGPAEKILRACRASREITLEAWIVPAGPAPAIGGVIVGLSRDVNDRNVALVQVGRRYEVSLRTSTTDAGGGAALEGPDALALPRLTHLVFVRSADGREKLYVDGQERSSRVRTGTFETWNPDFSLMLAGEATEERPWSGTIRLVAVYARALGPAEVARNYSLGVDE